jgi:DNA-binding NarL/FixJ family response regulator
LADKEMNAGAEVVALTADLLNAARIRGSVSHAATVHDLDQLLSVTGRRTRLVLVDLQARDGVAAVQRVRARAPHARVVAFGPHVAETLLEEARVAGADEVMVRGAFVRNLAGLVAAL